MNKEYAVSDKPGTRKEFIMKRILSGFLSVLIVASSFSACTEQRPRITSSEELRPYGELLLSRLGDTLPENVFIGTAEDGFDMTDFAEDGYVTRAEGGSLVIYGKTEKGVDRGVRDYIKNGNPDSYEKTYNEGYRVKSITVCGRDISDFTVVVPADVNDHAFFAKPEDANKSITLAARELRDYIRKSCGAELEISTDQTKSPAIRLQVGDIEKYGDEAFSVEVTESDVIIMGGRYRGCLYGVYDFLEEDIGWRFHLDPLGQYKEYLYEKENVNITSSSDRFEKSAFNFRTSRSYSGTYGYNTNNIRVKRKITPGSAEREFGEVGLVCEAGHGINNNNFTIDGFDPQKTGQPCYTDEDVIEQIATQAVELAQRKAEQYLMIPGYDFTQIDVGQFDSSNFCVCQNCMKVAREEGSASGAVVRMTNRVAEAVHELYPEIVINMLGYSGTEKPPKKTVPGENVKVSFCFYLRSNNEGMHCNNHPIYDENCRVNSMNLKDFKGWLDICDTVDTWYYPFNCYDAMVQSPFFSNLYDDIMYLRSLGTFGINRDGLEPDGARLMALVQDVYAQIMWEDWTKEEYFDYIREWFFLNYGDAGEDIFDLLIMNEYAGDEMPCWSAITDSSRDRISGEYVKRNYKLQLEIIGEALSLVDTAEQEKFVELFSTGFLYMTVGTLFDEMYVNGTAEEREFISGLYEKMYGILKENNVPVFIGIGADPNRYVPDTLDLNVNPFEWTKK